MGSATYHKKFKLNDISFSDKESILSYARELDESVYVFLSEWFDARDYVIVNTSGSTGKPKPIQLKKEYMKNSAKATGIFFNLFEETSALLCLSTDFIAGKMMLVRALELGWYIDFVQPVSNPLTLLSKNYNFSAMVPMQLEKSLQSINRIDKLIVGGGVVSNGLINSLQNITTRVYATYGMTETITHIAVRKLNHIILKGYYEVLPNVTIYQDKRKCLVIKAPRVSDDLIVTNDVVQLVSNNHFEWLGRYDNVVNSGGIKLYPERIEEKLSKVISSRFFVASLDDEVLGNKLILLIEGDKRKVVLGKVGLTKYEMPKHIFFLTNFKLTKTGKIHRGKTLELLGF